MIQIIEKIENFHIKPVKETLFIDDEIKNTLIENINIDNVEIRKYTNEYWTSKQRQATSIHEVSYRACFKPQLPNFFITNFTNEGDIVYDPFTGRGTTIIESALLNRNVIANDINPISRILTESRLFIPNINELNNRIDLILKQVCDYENELTMFYHNDTFNEIATFKDYFYHKTYENSDSLDKWIQMIATNRLTGHSKGFFSVYTLPPNQAMSKERQAKLNKDNNLIPEYRNTKNIIIKKTKDLIKDINPILKNNLVEIQKQSLFLNKDARNTQEIPNNSVKLVVTSPPFLDVIQYAQDNWLRCWFNNINIEEVSKNITMSKTIDDWNTVMFDVLKELYRVLKEDGLIAFEVGEVRKGKIRLDEHIVSLALKVGFECLGIMINEQVFTKTANIWGVDNNSKGTNSNRIVLLTKGLK